MTKKLIVKLSCLLLIASIFFACFVPMLGDKGITAFADYFQPDDSLTAPDEQSEGVVRPEDIDEGLSANSLEDIRGRRVTVRQPVMEIVEKDIARKPADVLSDVYEMRNFKTGDIMNELAKIDFASNPDLQLGNKDHPRYPMKGLDRSEKDSEGNVSKQKYFSPFTKYMLLRQAYYFNTHVNEIIEKKELKKHPAADYIYGKISDDVKAVKMHIITDPIYRSPMTTGLYLVPGEVATVKIKGLKQGETVTLYTHHQDTMGYLGYREDGKGFNKMEDYLDYWDAKIIKEAERAQKEDDQPDFEQFGYGLHGQWQWQNQKVPCMGTTFNIVGTGEETVVEIGSMYGGPLYVKPTSSTVDMEISGAVLTPHFVLGVTTVEEFNEQLRNAPGLVATLDVENGQLIGPAEAMRNADDIEKLAYFWHSVFAIDISLNGRDYNYNMTMCYDMHVPAGEAVALNSNFCAQPEYWFPICMNYETLSTKGNWGTFHELGHVQAKTHGVNWGFCDGDGEVWNNTLILLIYSMLCNMDSRVIPVEHGEYVHPYTAVVRSQSITQQYQDKATGQMHQITDYGQINDGKGAHFDQLSMYATLLHSFGPEKFVDMFYTYKMNPAYCANKRADFVYRIGVVDRVNILKWVNDNYFAGITNNMFTASQLEFLNTLPAFVPVAYRWANGIDGHETARKYDVDGKNPTVFDLDGDNISSPKDVEIVSVTDGVYGHTDYDKENKRVVYTPPEDATEYDRFDIIVKTEGGRRVTLNVNMRLVYRGLYGKVWDLGGKSNFGGNNPSVEQARQKADGQQYSYTVTSPSAGLEFTHDTIEYLNLQLKYRAPQSGDYKFYVKADDVAEVDFRKGNIDGDKYGTVSVKHDTTSFTQYNNVDAKLNENDIVFIDCQLVNWGGKGHAHIGVLAPGAKEIEELPSDQIISAGVKDEELATVDSFKGWQPRFVDSIKNATIDYQLPKDGWQVIEAPENEGGSVRDHLLDGDEGTIYHSKYNGQKVNPPHVFVIDTTKDQDFNFFEFVRRTNGNDKLVKFALYACTENAYLSVQKNTTDTSGWTQLYDGSSSNVNAARQRISFSRIKARYFKFIVRDNNGGHTVLKEIYAGTESQLNQTVKPANYKVDQKDFEENSANGKITSKKAGATFVFEFLGSGFELFADTDPDFGSASIKVDDADKGTISLNDKPLFNKQVFFSEDLDMGVHRVTVTTLDEKPFNISFINVRYGTPVAADETPAQDYGNIEVDRQFTREWKTYVKDYKSITSIKFLKSAPQDYNDTYVRIDTYIRLYRDGNRIAFVYPGTILAPIACDSLFAGCENLAELQLDNFNTSNMRGTMSMFYNCRSIQSISLSDFNTDEVLSYGKMFGNCSKLISVDLSSFELDENANLTRMFENCTELKTIKLPNKIEGTISCELPYVYMDTTTKEFAYEFELSQDLAGHVLEVHAEHTFNNPDLQHQYIAPTCLEDGKVAYQTCTTCGCDFDLDTGKNLLREGELEIPELGHHYNYVPSFEPGTQPNCTRPGEGGSYVCYTCGDEVEVEGDTPALGHTYEMDLTKGDLENGCKGYKIEYRSDGTAKVTVYLKCMSYTEWFEFTPCGHETEVVIIVNYDTHQNATCDEAEFYSFEDVIYRERVEENMRLQDTEDTVQDYLPVSTDAPINILVRGTAQAAEANGHSWQTVNAFAPTCTAYGSTEGQICTVCGLTEGVTAIEPLKHDMHYREALAATCTEDGHTAGEVCTRCGELGEGVRRLPALDHDFSVDIAEESPTCTKVGHRAGKKCSRCDAIEGCELIDDLGHEIEVMEGRAPTATESGLTDGLHCSRCGEIFEEQQVIPALGVMETAPAPDSKAWIWAIVGVGAALVVAGAAVGVIFILKKKRR